MEWSMHSPHSASHPGRCSPRGGPAPPACMRAEHLLSPSHHNAATMPAYHSAYNDLSEDQVATIASVSILPFRTKIRGPAPPPLSAAPVGEELDIIDEAIDLFRANSLFRNFEIKGGADRLLIYLILFISQCLTIIAGARVPMSQNEALKQLSTTAVDQFNLPGDAGFPLNNLYQAPASRMEAGEC